MEKCGKVTSLGSGPKGAIEASNPLRPDLGPLSPQISSPGLKSAFQASNQLFRTQIRSQGLKSALQASNLCSRPQTYPRPQISFPGLKSVFQALNQLYRPQISSP